jgi:hypothetical protein
MRSVVRFVVAPLVSLSSALNAQHGTGGGAPRALTAPAEARQFDFLVGQWDLTVHPRVSSLAARIHGAPKLAGTWKAWRAFDGWGIEDELRIMDASGNPMSLSHALRVYDAAGKQWSASVLDVYRGTFGAATGSWGGDALTITSRGTDAEGRPTMLRSRFSDITADRFRLQQDRSTDGGKTWDEGVLRIEAKRSAAQAPR